LVKCLVVDDSETVRMMVTNQIQRAKESHEVLEAADGATALDLFLEQSPDVVFLDMGLGGQGPGGLDLVRRMLAERPGTNIILVTALAQEHPDVLQALSLGAFGYLRKPVRASQIQSALHDIEDETGHLRRVR
jgi:two-component system, chemotaxis family, chemotaxis protein CheY